VADEIQRRGGAFCYDVRIRMGRYGGHVVRGGGVVIGGFFNGGTMDLEDVHGFVCPTL